MACLNSLEMFVGKRSGWMLLSLVCMSSSLCLTTEGNCPLLPEKVLYTLLHLLSKSSKNSVGSGTSLGVGANFRPNSRALSWL